MTLDFELKIDRITRRAAGTWVNGTVDDHRFDALVFPDHAENPDYEIGCSRISKLWIQRLTDRKTVFNWDRGMDVNAADGSIEQEIVDFLCEGLATLVFEN